MSVLPKSVKSKVPFLPRLDSRFIEVEKDDAADEDLFEEPPCLCAQQIICTLFGAILGYAAVLVSPAQLFWPMAIAQGLGVTIGLFGSENSNIETMSLKDPLMILFVTVLSAYISTTFVGAFNQGNVPLRAVVWTSFLLSNLAMCVRALTRNSDYEPSLSLASISLSSMSLSRSNSSDGMVGPSPRRLKFKHSGDSTDWFEKDNNIMKV